jgi:hypothetical protein
MAEADKQSDEIKINQSVGGKVVLHRNIPLEADNVLIIVCALLIGLALFLFLSQRGFGLYAAISPAAVMVSVSSAWALLLKQGKPPAYDVDFVTTKLFGHTSWEANFRDFELEHYTK